MSNTPEDIVDSLNGVCHKIGNMIVIYEDSIDGSLHISSTSMLDAELDHFLNQLEAYFYEFEEVDG